MATSRSLFIASVLGMIAAPAAAETAIRPVPMEECNALVAVFAKATGFKLAGSEQDAPPYPDGLRGKACWMGGGGHGITMKFDKAADKITAAVAGLKEWTHDTAQDADGPFATTKVFTSGHKRLVYTFAKEPPKGACIDDRPIVDCKAPAKRWEWSFSASAYMQ